MVLIPSTACFSITTYAVTTFQKVGTSINPYVSSIILAVSLIVGSMVTTYVVDKIGRRALSAISLLGSACGLAITALYQFLYLNGLDLSSFAFVPVASLCFTVFISSAGITPCALVCSVENLPSKVRLNEINIFVIQKFQPEYYSPILFTAGSNLWHGTIDMHVLRSCIHIG